MRKHRRKVLAKQAFGPTIWWDRMWPQIEKLQRELERKSEELWLRGCQTVTGRFHQPEPGPDKEQG